MCNFISWIEKDGKVYFLTDHEVFSEYGKERLVGCKDNDFVGHGAIRKFYGIEGGIAKECWDFWNTKELPKPIAKALKNFESNFGKLFRECLYNDDLKYILIKAPARWRAKASEELLKRNPTDDDLTDIIKYSTAHWRAKAWNELLK